LKDEGVVRIDNVLPRDLADKIRKFVFELRKESEDAVQSGKVKPKERFADVLQKENRCDMTLPLANSDGITADGLVALLQQSAIGETIKNLLGKDAVLYEFSCLISDPGSSRQVMHPDTPCATKDEEPVLYTCFVALQDITADMGPTTWMPGTHTLEAHQTFKDEQAKDEQLKRGPAVLGLLPKGCCGIFDSRLLHCGGANISFTEDDEKKDSLKHRAVFYFSFRNPKVPNAGNPGSSKLLSQVENASCQHVCFVNVSTLTRSLYGVLEKVRPNLINKWTLSGLEKELKTFAKNRKSDVFLL